MSRDSWQAVRAVFLAAIMVISVLAAGVAFSGSAVASNHADLVVDDDFESPDQETNFSSIQNAVDSASENDVIVVRSGTYEESVTIDTNGLTLEGPNAGIAGDSDERGDEASFQLGGDITADDVTLDGFELVPGPSAGDGSSRTEITGANTVIANSNVNVPDGDAPFRIKSGADNSVITQNQFANGDGGNFVLNARQDETELIDDIEITDNTFRNLTGTGTTAIQATGFTNANISGNNFNNIGEDGIRLDGNVTGTEITDNEFSNYAQDSNIAGGQFSAGAITAVSLSGTIDITENRFDNSGGDNVYINLIAPNDPATIDIDTVSEQNTFNNVVKTDSAIYSSIQPAVDAASSGDTIQIGPGTYDESVEITTEDITLVGPNAGTPGDDTRSEEATITQGVAISADGVTVDGLEVTNDDVNGITITGAPSDVTVTNTVVRDIAGGTAGASKGVGNGINLQFNNAFEQTSTGIEITDNLITNITTADASGSDTDADAIGVQLLPRGNDVENLRIASNNIENIEPGAAPDGRSEARAVSIGTQFTNTSGGERGDLGQATNLTVANNDISNLTADFARAVALFEDKEGAASTPDDPVGPADFTITGNNVSNVKSEADFFDLAIFVGEYGDFGDSHTVQNNDFTGAAVENFGDSDALSTSGNTFSGDPKFDIHYTAANADLNSIISSNTFDKRVTIRNASGDLTGDTVFAGIQSAIDAASSGSGDTVSVGPGTYEESVTVDVEGLTLTAVDQTEDSSIVTGDHKEIIEVAASDVTVEGFTVTSPEDPDSNYGSYGIRVLSEEGAVSDVTVRNNTVKKVRDVYRASGISVSSGVTDNELVDVSIENNSVKDIAATQESTDAGNSIAKGIVFNQQVRSSEISGNNIVDIGGETSSAAHGIAMDGSGPTNFSVQNNEIDNLEAVGSGDDPYFNEANAIIVGGYADLGGEHTVESNNILDGQVYRFDAGPSTDLLVAPLNWWGTERGPNGDSDASVGSRVAYDPFLTAPVENIEVDEVSDTQQFAQDVIAPAGQDVTAVGFPGPVPDGYTVGDAFENVSGGAIYKYSQEEGRFALVTGGEEISALDAFVIVQNSTTSNEDTQVVIEYAETQDPDAPGGPAVTTIEPGFNLISPRSLGDAYGAFDAPSDRETIYGTYGAPLERSESAFLGPADQDTNFIHTTFGPNQDDPVVTPYGGYLVFTQEEREITTFVQRGTTADQVINNLNQTAT